MARSRRTTPEQRVAQLRERSHNLSAEALSTELRQGLQDASNFVVEYVAKLIHKHGVRDLIPELVTAWQRFAIDGHDCDKGCRAKLAIVEALLPLDYEDPDFWLAGMRYRQQEPVWNGSIDTAADIRGLSAFGLVRSQLIAPSDLQIALTDLLTDSEWGTRAHAVRAIVASGLPGCVALLRLKALLGDSSSEVLGACYSGLLELDPGRHVEFVAGFLNSSTDIAIEAALALGSSRNRDAAKLLLNACAKCPADQVEPFWVSLGLSRQPEAVDFLISRITNVAPDAAQAIRALAPIRLYDGIADRVLAAVQATRSRELSTVYNAAFNPTT